MIFTCTPRPCSRESMILWNKTKTKREDRPDERRPGLERGHVDVQVRVAVAPAPVGVAAVGRRKGHGGGVLDGDPAPAYRRLRQPSRAVTTTVAPVEDSVLNGAVAVVIVAVAVEQR